MTRNILITAFALSACFLALPSSHAQAQCGPGAWVCADVQVGGSFYIGRRPPPQQVIVVQPAPPPAPPPPRQVVVVQEPQPEPPVVVVQQQPQQTQWVQTTTIRPRLELGLHGYIGGVVGNHLAMGGATGAFRIRPSAGNGRFALDLGIGAYGGQDYNGLDRVEVPVTADLLLFINPEDELQVYALGGLGVSFAHAEGINRFTNTFDSRDYGYVGGELGLGVEWRLAPHWALNADVRGFIRQRVDSNESPEFVDESGNTTDTSAGGLGTLGLTFYF